MFDTRSMAQLSFAVTTSETGIFNLTSYPFQNSPDTFMMDSAFFNWCVPTSTVSPIGISSKGKTSDNTSEIGKKTKEILKSKGNLYKVSSLI